MGGLKTKASRGREDFFLSLIKQNYFKRTVLPVAIFGVELSIDLSTFVFAALFSKFFVPHTSARVGANTSDTMDISLIRIFIEGPEVSLKGSPTVSPVTDALWGSEPLKYFCPFISTPF